MKKFSMIFLGAFMIFTIQKISSQNAKGDIKGLVILIDFPDAPANPDFTVGRTTDAFNKIGYTETSITTTVRDYWNLQSRGKVDFTSDVFGYFRAPETTTWYNDRDWDYLTLFKQALEWVKENNPNYDWDSLTLSPRSGEEGTFLSLMFIPSTEITGSGGTGWIGGWTKPDDNAGWTAPNGSKAGQYSSIPIFNVGSNAPINLFNVMHEQGHMVWTIPDTYDPTGESSGTGHYSVMSGNQGNGQIESFGAPFLIKQGWVDVVDLQPNKTYTLTQDGNSVGRYVNPSDPKEYFVIEPRMKSTLGNQMVPSDRGLLIWHADENVKTGGRLSDMTPSAHYEYSIEQADGRFDLENRKNQKDGEDMFVEGQSFSNNTTPDSKWWDGQSSGLKIDNIKFLPNNKIQFDVNGGGEVLSVQKTATVNSSIQIVPNPFQSSFKINIETDVVRANIYSLSGQLLRSFDGSVISVPDLGSGIYVLKVTSVSGQDNYHRIVKR